MNDIDVDQPVRVTPELAQVIARMLSVPGSYPGTTAEDVARELGKSRGDGRNIVGMFAADSLRDAIDAGVVAAGDEGVLAVRV